MPVAGACARIKNQRDIHAWGAGHASNIKGKYMTLHAVVHLQWLMVCYYSPLFLQWWYLPPRYASICRMQPTYF